MQIFHVMRERGWSPLPTVYQGAYSAVQRDAEKDLLPICRSEGMRYYAYSPLARGVLTDKFASAGAEGANPMQQRYLSTSMTDALGALQATCAAHGGSGLGRATTWPRLPP